MSDDQDFFFDEDEKAAEPAKTAAKAAPAKSGSAKPAAATAAPADAFGTQSVSMSVAALIGVIALLAGVIVGILLPLGNEVPAPTTTAPTGQTAPQLSPEQLQGGELPPGHPSVGGQSGTPTGSAETTGN